MLVVSLDKSSFEGPNVPDTLWPELAAGTSIKLFFVRGAAAWLPQTRS